MGTIFTLFVLASGVGIYLDASANKIGHIKGDKGMFNSSAGAWGVVTLMLWIVAFPAYLIKRSALIELAKANPVESGARPFKAIVLAIPVLLYGWVQLSVALGG